MNLRQLFFKFSLKRNINKKIKKKIKRTVSVLCSCYVGFAFRVTLEDGTQWLVHKGDGYGILSQTVVVDARHMSKKWKVFQHEMCAT